MALGVKFAVDRASAAEVQSSLRALKKIASGPEIYHANREVGNWLLRWINSNFKTEGGKVGRWKELKAGGRWTGKGKSRRFDESAKILSDTRALSASFDFKPTRKNVTVGSDLEYSKYHALGVPKRNLVIRRMLPLDTDRDVTAGLLKIYNRAIVKSLIRVGGRPSVRRF